METKESTSVLNDLILINNDRIEGYQTAIKELNDTDTDLKALFSEMISESQSYKSELVDQVAASGEEVDDGTTNSGKIYRVWMDIRATFSGGDRKAVLANCEFGEDAAQKAYDMALKEDLPADLQALLGKQKAALRLSHDKIKALRDAQP